jgi:uncharacterized protein
MKRILAAAISAVCFATVPPAFADDDLETARAFLDAGLYAEALTYLRVAADEGDTQAAEILGFLHSYGPEMFPGVVRDPVAAREWFERAARGGRSVGRYMSCALQTGTARICLQQAGSP